ncbi:hypothetical protein VPH35_110468 [Triticum aestivum]|uniref:uncharacterized protein isoform X2 n=1 Tax=Triticum aestivum TaxID=4565 RepID=UPI001D01AF54|nr:uncharacterized protein LOC123136777 isoform X2 [Triticum aestivum]
MGPGLDGRLDAMDGARQSRGSRCRRRLICGSDPVLSGSGGRARSKCKSWALGQAIPYPVKLDLAFFKAGNRWRNLLQERGVGGPASMEFLLQPLNSTTTLLEKVNENNNTIEPLHYPVMAPAVVELPAPAASSAEGQICVEGAAPEPASADKGQGSEHSIEQVDPKAPGWTQRVRVGAAALG